jgi:hypothetical protein
MDKRPRTAIYINNHRLKTSSFESINVPIHDITAVSINTTKKGKPTLVINIYNPGDEKRITPLCQYI